MHLYKTLISFDLGNITAGISLKETILKTAFILFNEVEVGKETTNC